MKTSTALTVSSPSRHTGAKLDLSDLVSVGLHFGPGFGSAEGRLVLDDVQFESMFADDRRNP